MNRIKVERCEDGLYYWSITCRGEIVMAGTVGYESAVTADRMAREEWGKMIAVDG